MTIFNFHMFLRKQINISVTLVSESYVYCIMKKKFICYISIKYVYIKFFHYMTKFFYGFGNFKYSINLMIFIIIFHRFFTISLRKFIRLFLQVFPFLFTKNHIVVIILVCSWYISCRHNLYIHVQHNLTVPLMD